MRQVRPPHDDPRVRNVDLQARLFNQSAEFGWACASPTCMSPTTYGQRVSAPTEVLSDS